MILLGERLRCLIQSYLVPEGGDSARITGITETHAGAIPMVNVVHPEAKVTHNTAIGSVERRSWHPNARSLPPEQARELIVNGILREAESCANRLAGTIMRKS